MEEQNSVFREKSLKRISSPDQLNDYIKVSNPGIWAVLIAMIILVIAALIWGFTGRIPTTKAATGVLLSSDQAICFLPLENVQDLSEGMEVQIVPASLESSSDAGYIIGTIKAIDQRPLSESEAASLLNDDWLYSNGYPGGYCCKIEIAITKDSASRNGMKWGGGIGAQKEVELKQPAKMSIITEIKRPIDLLLK